MEGSILARRDCLTLDNGMRLRLLSALEVLQARREAEGLARAPKEHALCSNACLLARALETEEGSPVFSGGEAVLAGLRVEEIAALSLLVVLRECRQLGTALTPAQGCQYLQSHILPHQNRKSIRGRTEEIAAQLQTALDKINAPGVRGEAEKRGIAGAWLDLALSCAKVSVKYDGDELKQRQKEEQTDCLSLTQG